MLMVIKNGHKYSLPSPGLERGMTLGNGRLHGRNGLKKKKDLAVISVYLMDKSRHL